MFTSPNYNWLAINIISFITGITTLAVGLSVQATYNEYYGLLPQVLRSRSLPVFCIVIGGTTLLIAGVGIFIAFIEKLRVIDRLFYVSIFLVLMVFQLSTCIAGFALRTSVVTLVHDQLTDTMGFFGFDLYTTMQWDKLQRNLECCGVAYPTDWLASPSITGAGGVPMSCCPHQYGAVNSLNCTIETAYPRGCAAAFGGFLSSQMGTIGLAGLLMFITQIFIIVGLVWVIIKVANGKTEQYWDNSTVDTIKVPLP